MKYPSPPLNYIDDAAENLDWYLTHKYLSPRTAEAVHDEVMSLLDQVHPIALDLVDTFGIPDHILNSLIAGDWEEALKYV